MEQTLLYRCPGDHRGPSGRTYEFRPVNTPADLNALLKAGWSRSLPEALAAEKVALSATALAAKASAQAAAAPAPLPPPPAEPEPEPAPPAPAPVEPELPKLPPLPPTKKK